MVPLLVYYESRKNNRYIVIYIHDDVFGLKVERLNNRFELLNLSK